MAPRYPLFDVGFNTTPNNDSNYNLYGGLYTDQQQPSSWFDQTKTVVGDKLNDPKFLTGAGEAMQGFGSLFGAYNSYKQAQIAKDQLDFEKKRVGYNIAAQSKAYNNQVRNQAANEAIQFGKGNDYAQQRYNQNKLSGHL